MRDRGAFRREYYSFACMFSMMKGFDIVRSGVRD